MTVATDAQRELRLQQLERQKAYEAGRFAALAPTTIAQLVRTGSAMQKREQKSGKQTFFVWEPTPALRRLLDGSAPGGAGLVRERIKTFCDAADADRELRELAYAQNIDPKAGGNCSIMTLEISKAKPNRLPQPKMQQMQNVQKNVMPRGINSNEFTELARLKALFEPLGLCEEQRAFLPAFLQKYETLRRGNVENTPSGKVTICPVRVGGERLQKRHEWALVDVDNDTDSGDETQIFFDNLYHAYDAFIVDLVVTVKRCHAAHPDGFEQLVRHLDCELTRDAHLPSLMVLKARRPNRSRRPGNPQTAITWVNRRVVPTPNVPPNFTACLHLPKAQAKAKTQRSEAIHA